MKTLILSLSILLLSTAGCVSKNDLKQVDERLTRVEVSEKCHGSIVELQLFARELSNPVVTQNPAELMRVQIMLQALSTKTQDACKKYDEMNGIK